MIQFQYLELFSPFLLMVWYSADGKKQITLDGALNCFKNIMRLSTSSDNCMLGFSDTKTIDLLLDSVVVDLSSCRGGDGHINMTSSSSSLLSLGAFVGLTLGIDRN